MPTTDNETRTRPGTCPTHGRVTAEKQVPKLKFPFTVTGPKRVVALTRPYHCPDCGAKV